MNFKNSIAFAIGLWAGGLLVGIVSITIFRGKQPTPPPTAGAAVTGSEALRQLQVENARLTAEIQRWKQTTLDLKDQNDAAQTAATNSEALRQLQAENARLTAEIQRLKQTTTNLRSPNAEGQPQPFSAQAPEVRALRALFADIRADPRQLQTALENLLNPVADAADAVARLEVADELIASVVDESTRGRLEAVRNRVVKDWSGEDGRQ